jgi:hypothetical protein
MLSVAERRIAYIQGPKEICEEEFVRRYVPQLENALIEGCCFVIGHDSGVDNLSLKYLLKSDKLISPRDITIFLYWKREYNPSESVVAAHFKLLGVQLKQGYITRQQRDEALLHEADFFIK